MTPTRLALRLVISLVLYISTVELCTSSTPSPVYVIACVEPAEEASGLRRGHANPGSRVDLVFLDREGDLISTATMPSPHISGREVGIAAIMPSGLLLARSETGAFSSWAVARLPLAELFSKRTALHEVIAAPAWEAKSRNDQLIEAIDLRLEALGRAAHWRLPWGPRPRFLSLEDDRETLDPSGTTQWLLLSLKDEAASVTAPPFVLYQVLCLAGLPGAPQEIRLVDVGSGHWVFVYPSWSPDGRFLAFYRFPAYTALQRSTQDVETRTTEGWQLCILDVRADRIQTYGPRTSTYHPVPMKAQWSPDGQQLLCSMGYEMDATTTAPKPSVGVFLVDRLTGEFRRLSAPPSYDWALSWAPTGDRFLFFRHRLASDPNAKLGYGVGTVDPPSFEFLIDSTRNDIRMEIAWSPDAKYLAYACVYQCPEGWRDSIQILNVQKGGPPREVACSRLYPINRDTRRFHNVTWLNLPGVSR